MEFERFEMRGNFSADFLEVLEFDALSPVTVSLLRDRRLPSLESMDDVSELRAASLEGDTCQLTVNLTI